PRYCCGQPCPGPCAPPGAPGCPAPACPCGTCVPPEGGYPWGIACPGYPCPGPCIPPGTCPPGGIAPPGPCVPPGGIPPACPGGGPIGVLFASGIFSPLSVPSTAKLITKITAASTAVASAVATTFQLGHASSCERNPASAGKSAIPETSATTPAA